MHFKNSFYSTCYVSPSRIGNFYHRRVPCNTYRNGKITYVRASLIMKLFFELKKIDDFRKHYSETEHKSLSVHSHVKL